MRWYCEFLETMESLGLAEGQWVPPLDMGLEICHLFDCFSFKRILELGRGPASFGLLRWAADPDAVIISVDTVRSPKAIELAKHFAEPYLFVDGSAPEILNDERVAGRAPYDLIYYDMGSDRELLEETWRLALAGLLARPGVFFLPWMNNRGKRDFFDELEGFTKKENCRHSLARRSLVKGHRCFPGIIFVP
jgi:tRNA A58 N-methylase Trm61